MNNEDLTSVFKALSHQSRRDILDLLKDGPMSTSDICDKFLESRFAVMKHLDILQKAELVVSRKQGRFRLYFFNAIPIQQLYNRWINRYESQFSTSLVNLKEKLEMNEGSILTMSNQTQKPEVSSFQIEQEILINAPRNLVFDSLTKDINEWWAFGTKGVLDKGTLFFEPKLGGRFYEDWGNGQGIIWGIVTYFKESDEIRLNGPISEMKGAVNSNYGFKLEEKGSATVLKLSHQVVGLLEPEWEQNHRNGWNKLLNELFKNYIEEKLKKQNN
ncbi:metalloregulator ArsR/SmtB family transcription factor [Neobacillus sp. FSL H8-0543]|uniref:metalloregulator ArsR/SmtB family transcription factor n=1 Tax=Neobacillus sp. FSL H8-0543 TaxID=2954672 RepID=UPI003157FA2E